MYSVREQLLKKKQMGRLHCPVCASQGRALTCGSSARGNTSALPIQLDLSLVDDAQTIGVAVGDEDTEGEGGCMDWFNAMFSLC